MEKLKLILITSERLESYKKDMQEAFQYGYEIEYGKSEELILPKEDINQSLNAKNSFAYEAVVGNEYEVVIRFGCCLNVRDLKSGATSIINADRFAPTQA